MDEETKKKLDKIIELLQAIKTKQETPQYYYPPVYYHPPCPYSNEPWPHNPYPQPNWTSPDITSGEYIYMC